MNRSRILALVPLLALASACADVAATDIGTVPPATTEPPASVTVPVEPTVDPTRPSVGPMPVTSPSVRPVSPEVPPRSTPDSAGPPPEAATPLDPVTLRPGDIGEEVGALQQRLLELGFWLDEADGHYGELTEQAVLAFQKVQGLSRDGLAGPATRAALATATAPRPRSTGVDGPVVEIDLERQVLLVVRGDDVEVFNTSTGAGGRWTTPPGRFIVEREIDGVRHAPLGDLYRPKYFNGGIAVHGSPSIPAHPASHGCARVHDDAMDHLWATGSLDVGTPVWVY